jgi:hypothetical protein
MPYRQHLYPEPLFLVAADRGNSLFNVVGPVKDDLVYVRVVTRLQDGGRKVQVFNPGEYASREDVISSVAVQLGFLHTNDPIVGPNGS